MHDSGYLLVSEFFQSGNDDSYAYLKCRQTETGSHIAVNLPGATPMKPGSCAYPYYGIELAVVDPKVEEQYIANYYFAVMWHRLHCFVLQTGLELGEDSNAEVEGVLCIKKPWPSMGTTSFPYLNTTVLILFSLHYSKDGAWRS